MNALLDTHALVWWVDDPKRLSAPQRRAVRQASASGQLWVSDISCWEFALLVERRRLRPSIPIGQWLERATAAPAVRRVGITPAIAEEVAQLSTTHDWDPADRILVATARVLGATLITADFRILDSALVPTL